MSIVILFFIILLIDSNSCAEFDSDNDESESDEEDSSSDNDNGKANDEAICDRVIRLLRG